ncbi:hypothetical protein H6G36_29245 [Anabaena minutissima FACHB-250]|nr:hypothetical protein [Anabaena minutissima FACHB-250]
MPITRNFNPTNIKTTAQNGDYLLGIDENGELYKITKSDLLKENVFTFSGLPGLELWLDALEASTIFLSAATASQWNDKSGNARNAIQGSASNQPTYIANGLNGYPTLSFDGVNDALLITNLAGLIQNAEGSTTVAVLQYDTGSESSPGAVFVSNGLSTTSSRVLLGVEAGYISIGGRTQDADTFKSVQSTVARPPTTIIQTGVIKNSEGLADLYVNGVKRVNNAAFQSPGNTSNTAPISAVIGTFTASPRKFKGLISEVLMFDRALSLLEIQQLDGYLAHKWNLAASLPADHPYKNNPPTA